MNAEPFTRYAESCIDTVFRVSFNYIISAADAEEITQNVFLMSKLYAS